MLGVAEDDLPETPTLHLNIYIYTSPETFQDIYQKFYLKG